MTEIKLYLTLKSDATFGRGEGQVGVVDQEIEYNNSTGLPYLRGRTLKGLLVEECANILFVLSTHPRLKDLEKAAQFLFGNPGSSLADDAYLKVGSATLPQNLIEVIQRDIELKRFTSSQVLEALTAIRRQTSIDLVTNAPEKGSLRSMRVLLRETPLVSILHFAQDPEPKKDPNPLTLVLPLLAACVCGLRRAGTARNRGRGRLEAYLESQEQTRKWMTKFYETITAKGEM